VVTGKLYGALHFNQNFSEALAARLREGEVDDDTVEESSISVWVDVNSQYKP
jgi:hypothetical protein